MQFLLGLMGGFIRKKLSGGSFADLILKVEFFICALLEEVVDRVFWVGKGGIRDSRGVLGVFEWILGVFEWIFVELLFGSEFIFHDFEVIFFIEVAVVEDF